MDRFFGSRFLAAAGGEGGGQTVVWINQADHLRLRCRFSLPWTKKIQQPWAVVVLFLCFWDGKNEGVCFFLVVVVGVVVVVPGFLEGESLLEGLHPGQPTKPTWVLSLLKTHVT